MTTCIDRCASLEVQAKVQRRPTHGWVWCALAVVLLAPGLLGQTAASQPLLDLSIPHPSVTAGTPEAGATFGWSMAMGDLDGNAGDELLVSSFFEDATGGTPANVGAAYAYKGTSLAAWNSYFPSPAQADLHAGRLFMSIGVVRTGAVPWAFVGGMNRDVTYACSPSVTITKAGEIAAINFNNGAFGTTYPPTEPSGSCAPAGRTFGHGNAVGDVNGDGTDDLVVGAPGLGSLTGRVYVFFGGSTFPNGWVAFTRSGAGNDGFGFTVAVVDLDGDSSHVDDAIVVGAHERGLSPTPGPGHAYAFRTSDIAALATSTVHSLGSTSYQTLSEPSGAANQNGFGWVVFEVGDIGGPSGALDGYEDVAIHAEGTSQGSTTGVGSLSVFWGKTPGTSPLSLLDTTNAAFLQVPSGFTPFQGERVGRGAASVDWEGTSPSGIKKGLLVGSPDYEVTVSGTPYPHAGRVFFYYTPVTSSSGNAWVRPLYEPDPSQTGTYVALPKQDSRFGAWIVAGEYNAAHTGQQFVVSARERTEGTTTAVGRVYAFYRP